MECINLRWERNEKDSQTRQAEVYVYEALKAVLTRFVAVRAQMNSAVQSELRNAFQRVWTAHEMDAKRTMTDVRGSLERSNAEVDRKVAQCAAVLSI